MDDHRLTRRSLLKGGLALGAAGAAGAPAAATGSGLSSPAGASIERALAMEPGSTNPALSDIRHVVILMQENRSFDHYFGALSGVRGFSDPFVRSNRFLLDEFPAWQQFGYQPGVGVNPWAYMEPFHLEQSFPTEDGATTNDISHEWDTQHDSWNGGTMDNFVRAHLAADGVQNFATTMGYFTRADLPFYYALADAFTICDAYHCSVLGPTDPNRVMALSASIDPAGTGGGPVLVTQTTGRPEHYGKFTWTTMPEQLLDAGVTWKVYNDPTGLALFSPLPYFEAYTDPDSSRGLELTRRSLAPDYPADLVADVTAGTLPQVSWIHGPVVQCEHPATAPQWGENLVQSVLDILTSNPEVWAHTLFVLNYRRERRVLRPRAAPDATTGDGGRVPDREPAPRRRRRRPRPGRPRLPGAVPAALTVHLRRLRGDRHLRPHLDAAPHGDALRRSGAQPLGLAARHHRRHDERAGAGSSPRPGHPAVARRLAGGAAGRRTGDPQRADRHLRRGCRLPAPHRERDAGPGVGAVPATRAPMTGHP